MLHSGLTPEDYISYKEFFDSGLDDNIADYIPDNEFKKRVISYIKQEFSQLAAMKRASDEVGVRLKDSYYLYPGSHINRWRKQVL